MKYSVDDITQPYMGFTWNRALKEELEVVGGGGCEEV